MGGIETVALEPVDRVEVTMVMDNAIDILAAPTETASRPAWAWDWSEIEHLRAEHGLFDSRHRAQERKRGPASL